tara:strand:+ start:21891 stop:22424 length:534 start_codon:yes stop_codon:yes gene_type:complete
VKKKYKVTGAKVFLSLGSNLGDREALIVKTIKQLNKEFEVLSLSPVYETPPLGFEADNNFLNMCVMLKTKKTPLEVLSICQDIEHDLGRRRSSSSKGYESRPIDIDILLFDDLIVETENLTIPHKFLNERKFVLQPLNDIDPLLVEPKKNKTINTLLNECNDKSRILLYKKKLLTIS